jgi:predicted phosphodiesterase
MRTPKLRWLHCSDFHLGKDRTAQERLLEKIVEHLADRVAHGFIPDLVFITGDLANKGLAKEYDGLRKDFSNPLREALGGAQWSGSIYAVPGNHDVDRTKADTFDRGATLAPGTRFFDPSKEGVSKREILFPRFKAYRQKAPADVSGNWISSHEGSFSEIVNLDGVRVGVAGINTAWLSKDDHDKERLTPGLELAESALSRIGDCQVRFVVGHHPLYWLQEDQERRLRALFGHHRVIYLHGHLHKAEARREDGAGQDFLVLQSGAAFQARDDEPWRNGVLWGEIDLAAEQVRVSPRFWNPENYDWPVETGRFPERLKLPDGEWWAYPLPLKSSQKGLPNQPSWDPPEGWEVLTSARLEAQRREITPQEAERFFDGAEPDWSLALCPKLPRRAVVQGLADQIAGYRGQERPLVLLEMDKGIKVLWHADDTREIPAGLADRLPEGPWVIATDAADLTAKALLQLTTALRRAKRTDVRLLLCARDTDWRASGAAKLEWYRHADYRTEQLSGLSEADAALIAAAWVELDGAHAAGDPGAKAAELYAAAKHESAVAEGSLLGGALAVRRGEGLRDHVRRLLDRLGGHRLPSGGTLYHAFGYIAAMHAKGLDFLSRPVLARLLGCDPRMLGQQVVVPLAREAAAGGGSVLLTRHRRIAEAAVAIMGEEFGEDIGGHLEDLVRAAQSARLDGTYVPELHKWNYDLPGHFLEKDPETAIRIARAVLDAVPGNVRLAVNLARTHRECGDPAAGAAVLMGFTGQVGNDRSFWHEWATCAGNTGDYAVNAILGGWSLADQAASGSPDRRNAKLSLAGLGVAFGGLYQRFGDRRFIAGRGAVAHMGLRLDLDPKTRGYFERHRREAESAGAQTADPTEALEQLRTALVAAWDVCGDRDELMDRLAAPGSTGFAGLARLFSA